MRARFRPLASLCAVLLGIVTGALAAGCASPRAVPLPAAPLPSATDAPPSVPTPMGMTAPASASEQAASPPIVLATTCVKDFRPMLESYTCGSATLWARESAIAPEIAFEGAITAQDDVNAIMIAMSVPSPHWSEPRVEAGGLRIASFDGAATASPGAPRVRGLLVAAGKAGGSRTAVCVSADAKNPCESLARRLATEPEEWRTQIPARGHPLGGKIELPAGCSLSLDIERAHSARGGPCTCGSPVVRGP